jgi:23S rRNA (uridine2552-2'-O)-methyltransferase
VLDLGCAPGSWTKFAAERVAPGQRKGLVQSSDALFVAGGSVLGLDLTAIDPRSLPANAQVVQQDVMTWQPPAAARNSFDLLMSDMAPKTTGAVSVVRGTVLRAQRCLQAPKRGTLANRMSSASG